MQIIIDTEKDSRHHIGAVCEFLQELFRPMVISHADNPSTGRDSTIAELTTALQARNASAATLTESLAAAGLPPPPSLDLPSPAAVFGGAAVQVPLPPPATPPAPTVATGAPSSPTAATAPIVAPGGVEKDARGLPWDHRIHSSSKNKNANGTWRAKKGMNDGGELVRKVEAELMQAMAAPGPVVAAAPPPPEVVTPPASVVFAATGATPQPAGVLTPVVPPPPPGVVDQTLSFPGLMTLLTPAMAAGRINTALLTEACVAVGIPSLPLLATRPDLVPAVHDWLKARVQL